MDHWKKNLPVRTENLDFRLTSHGRRREGKSSVYEIDIQRSFDVSEKETNKPGKVIFEGCLTKPTSFEKDINAQELKPEEKKFTQGLNQKLAHDLNRERNDKVPFNRLGKENQPPDPEAATKFKEQIKKHLIENFMLKNDVSLKSVFQNICNEVDKNNQLHFHHHEHHHHYYFDDTLMNSAESQYCEATPGSGMMSNQEKSHSEKRTKGRSLNAYYLNCPAKSAHTHTTVDGIAMRNHPSNAPKNDDPSELEKTLKFSTATSHLRISNSLETIFCKNSDFVATHFYNGLELGKCESNEMAEPAPEKETLLMNVSYEEDSFGKDLRRMPRISADKIQAILPNTPRKIQVNSLFQERSESWGTNVKEELNNIKKELQRLEARHVMKRLKKGDNHKISIYSNKTFIVGNEKLFLNKKRHKENPLDQNEEPRVTVGYYVVDPEIISKDKEDYLKKNFQNAQGRIKSKRKGVINTGTS